MLGVTSENRYLLLELLADQQRIYGYSPTVRELAERANLSISTVHDHLAVLRGDGSVSWVDGQSRTLRLTRLGERQIDAYREADDA